MELFDNKILSALKRILFYTISVGVEAIIAAALLPILSRSLSPEEYGFWIIFTALLSFSRPVVSLMMEDAIRLNYFKSSQNEIYLRLVESVIITLFVLSISLLLIYPLSQSLELFLKFPAEYLWTFVVAGSLHGLYYSILSIAQFRGDQKFFFCQQVFQVFTTLLLTVLFLDAGLSWRSAVYGRILALFICGVCGFAWVKRNHKDVKFIFKSHSILKLSREGLFLIPTGLAIVIVPLTDRLVLANWFGHEETGYFGIAALFCSLITIAIRGFITTIQPLLFRSIQTDSEKSEGTVQIIDKLFLIIIPLISIVVVLVSQWIIPFLTSYPKSEISKYLGILAAATCVGGFYQHRYNPLHANGEFRTLVLSSIGVIVLNLVLTITFVQLLGEVGVAYGTLCAYLLAFPILLICQRMS